MRLGWVAGLALTLGCTSSEPNTPAPAEAATPTEPDAARHDITLTNVTGRACEYVRHSGLGDPPADAATTTLTPGRHLVGLAPGEKLALQTEPGRFGVTAPVGSSGTAEMLVHSNCRGIAASESGFTANQRAMAAPHAIDACCSACADAACTDCTERAGDMTCAATHRHGRCAVWDDVLDCVPAEDVDADGSVRNSMGPFRRKPAEAAEPDR